MAKIVTISAKSYRPGLNEIGDIVEIVDDATETTGMGYESFTIYEIPKLTKMDIAQILDANWPTKTRIATFTTPDNLVIRSYWQDPATSNWYEIIEAQKYKYSLAQLSGADIDTLISKSTRATVKLAILQSLKPKIAYAIL